MGKNQHEKNAQDLWVYFTNIIEWIKSVFPEYRREMKGLPWGELYNEYKNTNLDPEELEEKLHQQELDKLELKHQLELEKNKSIWKKIFNREG